MASMGFVIPVDDSASPEAVLWCGRPLSALSREELERAVVWLVRDKSQASDRHIRDLRTLSGG